MYLNDQIIKMIKLTALVSVWTEGYTMNPHSVLVTTNHITCFLSQLALCLGGCGFSRPCKPCLIGDVPYRIL